jgi:hypothetical protein
MHPQMESGIALCFHLSIIHDVDALAEKGGNDENRY